MRTQGSLHCGYFGDYLVRKGRFLDLLYSPGFSLEPRSRFRLCVWSRISLLSELAIRRALASTIQRLGPGTGVNKGLEFTHRCFRCLFSSKALRGARERHFGALSFCAWTIRRDTLFRLTPPTCPITIRQIRACKPTPSVHFHRAYAIQRLAQPIPDGRLDDRLCLDRPDEQSGITAHTRLEGTLGGGLPHRHFRLRFHQFGRVSQLRVSIFIAHAQFIA